MPIRLLSKSLQQKSEFELNEVPHRLEEDIQTIQDWLAKQPHLKVRTDEQWLINFIRCLKFSLERTKDKLDFYYTIRTLTPEYFGNRDPLRPELQDFFARGAIVPLPKPVGENGPAVMILRWGKLDPEQVPIKTAFKALLMVFDVLLMENDNFSVAGLNVIFDHTNFPMGYILQLNPAVAKKLVMTQQNAYPIRLKELIGMNFPRHLETLLNLFKLFINEKLRKRIKIYPKDHHDGMFETIPKSIFPSQYGGEGGCAEDIAAKLKEKIESYRDWFIENSQYKSDETKRPGNPKLSSDVFGIEGSFRKLTVD